MLKIGMGFLAPNILGFLAFTLFPLVFSLVMAFSNWDLRYHNMFKEGPLHFGIGNFLQLLQNPDFWRFLGNTLFFMLGIPFSVAGSLVLAILLSRDFGTSGYRTKLRLAAGALLVTCAVILALAGAGAAGMTLVLVGLAGLIFAGGALGGSTIYRTLCYLPHFTAGIATFILWKKIYSPHTGPLNALLSPVLSAVAQCVDALPAWLVQSGFWVSLAMIVLVFGFGLRRFRDLWRDGDIGAGGLAFGCVLMALPLLFLFRSDVPRSAVLLLPALFAGVTIFSLRRIPDGQDFPCGFGKGIGTVLVFSFGLVVLQCALFGLGLVFRGLPEWSSAAAGGLTPPNWLTDYHWAKPALMLMAFWGAVGSNSMLLYLAGLSNIPQELYEAADIDGASRFQRFWHVTWPQLAPVTFFIAVMAVISGLQGGFEMAYAMTQGGPAGATTTLSYFIYSEGFETGRLGYASGVAWTLFALVFLVTMFNWKFGNRYVND
ncbi:hypothetical protein OPIT5_09160 [Opitutaceae bacterium TAV5]|nr:hypothetical protein OPIT5_09160 [Opitutaceae bacterium TAV5]